jgi:hypothetical protein
MKIKDFFTSSRLSTLSLIMMALAALNAIADLIIGQPWRLTVTDATCAFLWFIIYRQDNIEHTQDVLIDGYREVTDRYYRHWQNSEWERENCRAERNTIADQLAKLKIRDEKQRQLIAELNKPHRVVREAELEKEQLRIQLNYMQECYDGLLRNCNKLDKRVKELERGE